MVNALIFISILAAMAWTIALLDWLGRRKDRQARRRSPTANHQPPTVV